MTSRYAALSLFFVLLAVPASAQVSGGVRVGASLDPDQFYFGGHIETPPLADHVHFRPNVEVGVGNNATVVAINFELAYKFPAQQAWHLYAVAGPALNIINTNHDTSAQGGITIGVGAEHSDGLFVEVKAGAINSPSFKIGIGYRFR
jgi:hypothetical protein